MKTFTLADKLLFVAAFLSLIFSEILYFLEIKKTEFYWIMGSFDIGIWNLLKIN
ncbi:MAG: hypothetical protein IPP71_20855 [Bacteroidetes bacterium]|nr:hypothetical protein [Bacteroidota bacterium]